MVSLLRPANTGRPLSRLTADASMVVAAANPWYNKS
jgi:hypothetical protein